jgi:D-alanine-D-alanine ligase
MKIALLFDGLSALGKAPEVQLLDSIEAVESALSEWATEVVRVPVTLDGRWIERVRKGKFDLVFNLCEGIDGEAVYEPMVISVLELMSVPFTGSSSWTTALTLRKNLVNAVLDRAGLPVPRWSYLRKGDEVTSVGFPAICKPAAEDASVGIEQRSVVRSMRALTARVDAMLEGWDEVLVQRFIDGREVNVAILGDETLPIAEIDFGAMPRGMWRIVSYRSKWETGSDEDLGARPMCPADLSEDLANELIVIARAAWNVVGGEGYGRADFRIDSSGRPWLLEMNANPDISPGAGLARMAGVSAIEYSALIRRICDLALAKRSENVAERWLRTLRLSGVAEAAGVG